MPKYAGNVASIPNTSFSQNLTNAANAVSQGLQSYRQIKIEEAAQATLANPNSSTVQKALAWTQLKNPQAAVQTIKQSGVQEAQNRINNKYPDLNPNGHGGAPNVAGATPVIFPTISEGASTQPQANQPQQTETAQIPSNGNQAPPTAQVPQQGQGMPGNQAQGNAPQGTQAPQIETPEQKLEKAARLRQRAQAYNAAGLTPQANTDLSEATSLENQAQKQRAIQQRTYESERDYATKVNEDFRKRMSGIAAGTPAKDLALNLAEQSVATGDVGAFSAAHLAQLTGLPIFQSAAGAGLSLAAKENLIGNLSRVSGRAQNQWLEQVMSGAFPRAGQSLEANQVVLEGIKADRDLNQAELQIFRQLEDADLKSQGYVGKDIEQRVERAFKPISEDIIRRTSYRTRQLWEREKNDKQLLKLTEKKAVPGTYLTRRMAQVYLRKYKDPEKAIQIAKKTGYKIPSPAESDEWGL